MLINWIEKYLTEAESMIYEKRVEEGLALLNRLLYEEPRYGSLHNHLGWAYFYHAADLARAERHFLMAMKFDPELSAPYQHLGALYIRSGKHAAAFSILEKGLGTPQANRSTMLDLMAQACELQKEFRKAIYYYREAMTATVGFEVETYSAGIKRCRKKQWAMLFAF